MEPHQRNKYALQGLASLRRWLGSTYLLPTTLPYHSALKNPEPKPGPRIGQYTGSSRVIHVVSPKDRNCWVASSRTSHT